MKYNRFEELPVWQASRTFVSSTYKLIAENNSLKKDYSWQLNSFPSFNKREPIS